MRMVLYETWLRNQPPIWQAPCFVQAFLTSFGSRRPYRIGWLATALKIPRSPSPYNIRIYL